MRKNPFSNVTVLFLYDGDKEYACPVRLLWEGQEYELGPVQFWHTTRHDGIATHHYTLSDTGHTGTFQLAVETDNLTWTLENYSPTPEHATPVWGNTMQMAGA